MNHLIQTRALCGGCDGRSAHGARRKGGNGCGGPAAIASHLPLGKRVILSELHPHELGRQVKHQGSVELAAMDRTGRVFEIAGEVEREDVDREHTSPPGAQRGERFLVRIVAVRCKNNEGVHAALLPRSEQVVHPAVQSLAADRGVAGIGALDGGVDAVGYRGGA